MVRFVFIEIVIFIAESNNIWSFILVLINKLFNFKLYFSSESNTEGIRKQEVKLKNKKSNMKQVTKIFNQIFPVVVPSVPPCSIYVTSYSLGHILDEDG